jgi:tetratricopeptide (TPR) repeat protein
MAEKVIGEDPFILVDSLTAKIAGALNLGAIDKSEAIATTPEAFKEYHLGMELFGAGDNDSAIVRFDKAIVLDSGFALPYLRIAMAHQFSGRNAMALPYFQMAQERKDRLPLRERRMLDAYYDTWALSEFDRAFTKIETLVHDYPDDAEIRTIYALYISAFRADTTATYAQFDTVLATYPTYAFAISVYAQILRQNGNLERSAYYVQRLIETLPNSVDPQIELILLRQRQGNWAEAYRLAEDLHRSHPDDQRPLNRLISLAFHMQEIDKARIYAEKLKALNPDDPYDMATYYQYLANADVWEGKFMESMRERFHELDETLKTGDSTQIFAAYNGIGDYYRRFEFLDSMDVYGAMEYEYATSFNRLNYLMRQARYFPEREATVRPQFETLLNNTRARVPREFWGTMDGLESMFDALLANDTTAMIAATRKIIGESGEQGAENTFQLGQLLVETGEFDEGKELLSRFLEGNFRTNNAWRFLLATYWVARANEGLGLTDEAIRNYQEFLKHWANADIQIETIRDAKERLAALTS